MSVNTIFSVSNAVSILERALYFLNAGTSDHYEHDEIHQSFNLTQGNRIEVSSISGSVEVESIDGDVAEVHIIRSAKIKTDLAWRKLTIERTPTGLIIEPVNDEALRPRTVRVDHYVLLKLPRHSSFTSSGVSGSINIAAIDGTVQVSGCSGSVIMKETNGPTDISGVSGSVVLNVTRLSEPGLRVSGISGTIELRLPDTLDAELSITDFNGGVFIDSPQHEPRPFGYYYYYYRLGRGGPRISVSGVSGNIIVRRS